MELRTLGIHLERQLHLINLCSQIPHLKGLKRFSRSHITVKKETSRLRPSSIGYHGYHGHSRRSILCLLKPIKADVTRSTLPPNEMTPVLATESRG